MTEALFTLFIGNKDRFIMDPLYSVFYTNHPSLIQRAEQMEKHTPLKTTDLNPNDTSAAEKVKADKSKPTSIPFTSSQ